MADPSELTYDDLTKMLDGNRTRIRSLGSVIASTCAFVNAVSGVILAYIYKGETGTIEEWVRNFLWGAIATSLVALVLVVSSFLLRPPKAVSNRPQMVNQLTGIYKREYVLSALAAVMLLLAVVSFAAAMVRFADTATPKPPASLSPFTVVMQALTLNL